MSASEGGKNRMMCSRCVAFLFPFLFHLQRPHFIVDAILLLSTFFFFIFPLPIFFISCITFRFLVFLFYIGTLIFHSLQRYGNGNGNATTVYLPIRKTFGVSIFAYIRTDKQCKNSMAENVEIMRNEERMKDPRESQNNTRTHRPKSARRGTNLIFDYIYLF